MKRRSNRPERMLKVESLERRQLLAAASALAAAMPPLPSDGAPAQVAPPRTRAGEDNGSGVCPRDRDSQDSTAVLAAASLAVDDAPQPQTQSRSDEDNTTGSGVFQRPRDRDSQDSAVPTLSAASTLSTAGTVAAARRTTSQLSAEEQEHLLSVREEEKLARDVYLTLGAQWNEPIFTNIAASEQQHMDAVKKMIDKYGLTDPVVDNTIGVFTNPAFTALYGQLVQAGSASVVDAYKVGALIEEMDIVDIRAASAATTHTDVQSVYDNLMRGSRNHLRSFYGQIALAGETYDAQYLAQEEFLTIATSPMETGGSVRGR